MDISWFSLLLTTVVEVGLGLTAYFGCCYLLPKIKEHSKKTITSTRTFTTDPNPLIWIIKPWQYQRGPKILKQTTTTKQMYFKTWVLYRLAFEGFTWITLILVTFFLITSVGWKLPFTSNLYYNLLFARANGQPNGAHITTYLFAVAFGWILAIKFKDIFLGILGIAFIVGVHEFVYTISYYLAYSTYLQSSDTTNVLKDVASMTMYCLFIFAFWKYPYQPIKQNAFVWPTIWFVSFMIGWFSYGSGFGYLPVSLLNLTNPLISHGQYNETIYYMNPIVNGLEILSWLVIAVGYSITVVRNN